MSQSRLSMNWIAVLMWIGVNFASTIIGGLVIGLTAPASFGLQIIGIAVVGAIQGGAQGLVIAYVLNKPGLVVRLAGLTALGYVIATLLLIALRLEGSVVNLFLGGIVIGSAQWLLLKDHFRRSGVWILATGISRVIDVWGMLITGLALIWLLRQQIQRPGQSTLSSISSV